MASRIQLLHEATTQDDDLCSLKHIVQAAWPSQIQEVLLEIQPYWNMVLLVYLNAYIQPNRLYIGLDCMIKSISMLQIVKDA